MFEGKDLWLITEELERNNEADDQATPGAKKTQALNPSLRIAT